MLTLPGRTASSVLWMIVGSGGQMVFQFVAFAIIARQVGPLAFGIVAIAAVFIELTGLIGRAGLTEVAIQHRDLSEIDASTAFWSSFGIGVVFTVILFAIAPWLAVAFEAPELDPVMKLLAPTSLLFAAGAIYEAKIRRSFGFKSLATRNMAATFVSGMVALIMAISGYGVYSLVFQRIVYLSFILLFMIYSTRWIPSFVWDHRVGTAQLRRGGLLAISSILGVGNQRIIDLVVGYVLGPTMLGYLRIAWRAIDLLLDVSIRPATAVTLTSLSLLQDDIPNLRRTYINIIHISSIFTYPIFLGSAVVAPEIIRIVFGENWSQSVVPMQILTLTAIFMPPLYFKSNLLTAVGALKAVFLVNLAEFSICAVFAYFSAHYGLEGAAFGNVLRYIAVAPLILASVNMVAGISWRETLMAVLGPLVAAVAMVLALWILKPRLVGYSDYSIVFILAVFGLILYLLLIFLIERKTMMGIYSDVLRKIVRGRAD